MKSAFVVMLTGVILAITTSLASAQEPQQRTQPSGRATMLKDANASAQADTDMSYGGAEATQSAAGSRLSKPCSPGTRCHVFSKH